MTNCIYYISNWTSEEGPSKANNCGGKTSMRSPIIRFFFLDCIELNLGGFFSKSWIFGNGHCEWNFYNEKTHLSRRREGKETYIDERIYVVGSGTEANSSELIPMHAKTDLLGDIYALPPDRMYISIWVSIIRLITIIARIEKRINKSLCEFGVGSTVMANTDTCFPIHRYLSAVFEVNT